MMKLISIVTPCYNEEDNVYEIYKRVKDIFHQKAPSYQYEHIFIDNSSTDSTRTILRSIASDDKNVKLIFNSRNFGHIRSPYYGLLQANGDAVILLVADLQDPPDLIPTLLQEWENGYKVLKCVKTGSLESRLMFAIRKCYYNFLSKISGVELTKNFTGFGLYDKKIISVLKELEDPYPYFRGILSEIGFKSKEIPYVQPVRKYGISKNNFYTLYDIAMLGITEHSKVPLRVCTVLGFFSSLICIFAAFIFFILKIIFWNFFSIGIIPIIISIFFLGSIQLFCIGLLGEYIGFIHTKLKKRPLVIEEDRINF